MIKAVVQKVEKGSGDAVDLSPRQRQILSLLRAGASNKDIAADLGIGVGTVKQHLVVLFRKLGVTSRTAAISKSLELPELGITGPEPVSDRGDTATYSALERRPVSVLSVRVPNPLSDPQADDGAIRKRIHQAFSDVAYDFGAVFFTHEGGRSDLIFGIRQARRHDALRAVRAAFAIHDRLKRGHGGKVGLQAAVACGMVAVSTDPDGAWSGESLSGAVIVNAQALAKSAPSDTVVLDGTARGMIDYLERGTADGVPDAIAIDAPFVWRHRPARTSGPLPGRIREQEILRSRLYRLRGGSNGVVRLSGETGMGKTTLLSDFEAFTTREHIAVDRYTAAIPDSQPHVNALDRFEAVGADLDLLSLSAVAQRLRRNAKSTPRIVLFDDVHLLNPETFVSLTDVFSAYAARPVLFVVAHRGPNPMASSAFADSEHIRLARLDRDAASQIVEARVGSDAPFADWVIDMAAGVPGFLCQISDYLTALNAKGPPEARLMPPLTLFSMIAERLEGLGLDRSLLHVLARHGAVCPKKTLVEAWTGKGDVNEAITRIVSAGVIDIDVANDVSFRHPVVGWVARHMSVSGTVSTGEGFPK